MDGGPGTQVIYCTGWVPTGLLGRLGTHEGALRQTAGTRLLGTPMPAAVTNGLPSAYDPIPQMLIYPTVGKIPNGCPCLTGSFLWVLLVFQPPPSHGGAHLSASTPSALACTGDKGFMSQAWKPSPGYHFYTHSLGRGGSCGYILAKDTGKCSSILPQPKEEGVLQCLSWTFS